MDGKPVESSLKYTDSSTKTKRSQRPCIDRERQATLHGVDADNLVINAFEEI